MNKNLKKRLMSLSVAATLAATSPSVANLVETSNESYEPSIKIEDTLVGRPRTPGRPTNNQECPHRKTIVFNKEATCTESGYEGRTFCEFCKQVVSSGKKIPAKGHTYGASYHIIEYPTCTKNGTKAPVCLECGYINTNDITYVPKLSHNIVWVTEKEATCEETGIKRQMCTICGEKSGPDYLPALGHNYGEWKLVKDATCTHTGLKVRECRRCDNKQEKIIPIDSNNHNIVTIPGTYPTCELDGYTESRECTECHKIFVKKEILPAYGHNLEILEGYPETCENPGLTYGVVCSECGLVNRPQEIIPALGHSFKTEILREATCNVEGLSIEKCTTCGLVIKQHTLEKTNHHIVIDYAIPATIDKEGRTEGSHCDVCGLVIKKQEITPKLQEESNVPMIDLLANNLFNKNLLLIEVFGDNEYSKIYDEVLKLYIKYTENPTDELYKIVMEEFQKLYDTEEELVKEINNEDVTYYYEMLNDMLKEFIDNYDNYIDQDPVTMIREEIYEYYNVKVLVK